MRARHFVTLGLLAAATVTGAAWWLQRDTATALRLEAETLRDEKRELARLQEENRRLTATLPAGAELTRLRADRVAVERLRTEIEKLKDNVQRRERALSASAP